MTRSATTWPPTDLYPSRTGDSTRVLERREPVVLGDASSGPLSSLELKRYERRGFLVQPALLGTDEVARYRAELDRLRREAVPEADPAVITEPDGDEVRSIFAVHESSPVLLELFRDPRILGVAMQLLGDQVYIHQSRINYKPGLHGKEFYWHSDFETWHVEDGMPAMRAVSCSVSLTPNDARNGALMLIPGSHRKFVSCAGRTPEGHYEHSLKRQKLGVPGDDELASLAAEGGIETGSGPAGSVTFFDCNVMHGSNSNITPWPRANVFVVFNSVHNTLVDPYCGLPPRPPHVANRRDYTPLRPAA